MNEQLLKTSGADILSSRTKFRKTLGGQPSPPPLCTRENELAHNLLVKKFRNITGIRYFLTQGDQHPALSNGVSLVAIYSNRANQIDRTARSIGVQIG